MQLAHVTDLTHIRALYLWLDARCYMLYSVCIFPSLGLILGEIRWRESIRVRDGERESQFG